MAYDPPNPNGPATAANSAPVVQALASSPVVGQVKISSGGTAVPMAGSSTPLVNGVIITADPGNTNSITIGGSGVNSTTDGTGNGYILYAGASVSFAVGDLSDLYINGAHAGDFVSYAGS